MTELRNPPAFPIWTPDMNVGEDAGPGMRLRDWFAGQALPRLLASAEPHLNAGTAEQAAQSAYQIADAMLAARQREDWA